MIVWIKSWALGDGFTGSEQDTEHQDCKQRKIDLIGMEEYWGRLVLVSKANSMLGVLREIKRFPDVFLVTDRALAYHYSRAPFFFLYLLVFSTVNIIKPLNVILTQVTTRLDFDQFQGHLTRVRQSMY